MVINVEDNYDGLDMCGECRMEGTTKRKRMMIRSRRSNNAMAGNVDNKNFHSQRVERRQAVWSGRGGYRWEDEREEITTSRGATSCDARCVRKTAESADAVVHNLEQLLHSRQAQGSTTCRMQRLWRPRQENKQRCIASLIQLEVVVREQVTMRFSVTPPGLIYWR
jgi:hypothetical protein